MKKMMLLNLMWLVIVILVISIGTYAWFTSRASSSDNVFETGELIIGVPYAGDNDGFINIDNLQPGGSVTADVNVKNIGDIDFKYKVSSEKSDGDTQLYDKLNVIINDGNTDVYSGPLNNLNTQIGTIIPLGQQLLHFTVSLPADANNYYQGKFTTAKINFDATQVNNTGWSE